MKHIKMKTKQVQLPSYAIDMMKKICENETKKLGMVYSLSRFLRDAALDKLNKKQKQ